MTQGQRETREQEVARVRSYLASQSMRRTTEQIVEALREAHRQFLEATAAIPDAAFRTAPHEEEWAAVDVLGHVCTVAAMEEWATRAVIAVIAGVRAPTCMIPVPRWSRVVFAARYPRGVAPS